ncbi:hypothetical protein PIB30_088505 [Stylosanthes scabra]|uniref:Disease resistance RPP13-like protein 1 n=1 Tax=Stylosanthes scabra TaxID=79078 RepID=A0ABU6WTN5_9FABA|nr:hypothetical protein [Stylosanthes scabra]
MAAKLEGGAYLSSFVDAISEKLSSLLEHDFDLELDNSAPELLQRLYDCLCDVAPVLDDAELKQLSDKRVKKWLVDLHDALYMVDDLLDELSTKAATAPPRDPGNSSPWSRFVDSCIEDSGVNVIQKIVGTLDSVVRRKGVLRLKESAKLDTSWKIPSTSLVVNSDIFGRDEDKENIIKVLLDDTCDAESHVTVIPIVGMGGIGKTTLAQLVYNDPKVVEKFDPRVWVCVAENSEPLNLTRTIIGAIDSSPCNMDSFDSLQTNLKKKLIEKTFLVVLDDVWDDRRDMWEDFLKPFRYGNNGSKILLTTRSENVASVFVASNLHYHLKLLSNEDCWSVFLKHSSISTKQYATLELIGKEIVKKCDRLPLAVKTLGGLLRNKCNKGDWKAILESKIWELSEDDSKIVPALRVSYHYLPSHLKRCFVFCSLFPEDYEFDKEEIVLLWMAEGFLRPKESNTIENIGCEYFDELVARSFFQPSSNNEKLFVMHDLLHDLATFFAGKFYFKLKEFDNRHMIENKTRHLSYATKYEDSIKLFRETYNGAVHMRTFLDLSLLLNDQSIDVESEIGFLRHSQCLRVLSFKFFFSKSLPDSICELIHLRYLNLSHTYIVTLSESIYKLYNLQILKLRNCAKLKILPSSMHDLVNLLHLDIRGASGLKEMPKKMSKLKHLNFLSDYIIGKHEENGIRELGALDNLHGAFCISNLENIKNSDEALEAKMGNKKHMDTLKLEWLPFGDIDDVQIERDILDKLQPHENLKELSIEGYRGETFPDWLGLSDYSNMTKMTLSCCMNGCELPLLGNLPYLQHLEFSELNGLEKIDFEVYSKNNASFQQETPFKCLETLKIENMPCWREWHFPEEFDGFPRLKILSIINCRVLRGDLPTQLPSLEELTIVRCEALACSLPKAPKLHQLYVGTSAWFTRVAAPHNVVISGTQLARSVLECLAHIQQPHVQRLRINDCRSAISISADYWPASLQYLDILCCSKLTFSEQLQHNSISEIRVVGCASLTLFPLGDFPNLKKLTVRKCPSMECFVVPHALPMLGYLKISECPNLVSLPDLGFASPQLEELHIFDCPEIDCFAEEFLPPSLKKLGVTDCQKLARWITSNGLQSEGLTHLWLGPCFDVRSFPKEGCLPASLEFLKLWNFPDMETLDCMGLHHLTSLKNLAIRYCGKLENIYIGEECPLRRKLEEMEDPRIQFGSYNLVDTILCATRAVNSLWVPQKLLHWVFWICAICCSSD